MPVPFMTQRELEDFKALLEMPSEDELNEIREHIEDIHKFLDRIDKFLRGKFLEEWDGFEEG